MKDPVFRTQMDINIKIKILQNTDLVSKNYVCQTEVDQEEW